MARTPRIKVPEGKALLNLRIRRPKTRLELDGCMATEDRAMLVYLLCFAKLTPEQQAQADALLASLTSISPDEVAHTGEQEKTD